MADTFTNTGEAGEFIRDLTLDGARRILRQIAQDNPDALDEAVDALTEGL